MRAEPHPSIDSLPEDSRRLLGTAGFFSTEVWHRLVCEHALPPRARPLFLDCGGAALLPLAASGRSVSSLTTPYTARYAPLGRAGLDEAGWRAAGEAAGRFLRGWASARLDALDADDPGLPGFVDGLRRGGLVVRRFDHFGAWREQVAGRDWAAYLAARPGQLRETLRRKARKAGGLRFETIQGGAGLEAGVRAYEQVYAASWKQAEPFPGFPAALIRAAAGAGWLRLGLCWSGDAPAAAQIWLVHGRQASVHKLAHDERAKAGSPGTLLTAHVLRPLLDEGALDEVDFGRGDDAYKRSWASARGQRVGLLAINPRRAGGAALLAREAAAAAWRSARRLSAGRARPGSA